MDKLADVLKIFIEKHLIPSVISIAGALATFSLVAEDNWILLKLGNPLFIILAFCVYFLAIQFVFLIVRAIKKAFNNMSEYNYSLKQSERRNQEVIRSIHEFVDSLSPEDKEILITFIQNGNKVLLDFERTYAFDSLLKNNNIINSSVYIGDIQKIDRERYWITKSLEQTLRQGMRPIGTLNQYRLKEPVYHDFSSVYKLVGKLGNF